MSDYQTSAASHLLVRWNFEWPNIPADACHPHILTPEGLLNWLHGCQIVKVGLPHLKEYWSDSVAFTGIFSRPF